MDHDYRVGDTERDRVTDRLQTHCGAGRLNLDELLQRTEAARNAVTWAELATLLRDLPDEEPPQRGWRAPVWGAHALMAGLPIGGLIGLWQITRDPTPAPKDYGADYWWPLWAAFFWGMAVLLHYMLTTGRLTLPRWRHSTAQAPPPAPGLPPQVRQHGNEPTGRHTTHQTAHPGASPTAPGPPLGQSTSDTPSPAQLDALTPREQEILVLVAEGHANKQIAQRLVISERTARTHVSNILHKLGLPSRTHAALAAVRAGLTQPIHQPDRSAASPPHGASPGPKP